MRIYIIANERRRARIVPFAFSSSESGSDTARIPVTGPLVGLFEAYVSPYPS
jgi:hypothetical protein